MNKPIREFHFHLYVLHVIKKYESNNSYLQNEIVHNNNDSGVGYY